MIEPDFFTTSSITSSSSTATTTIATRALHLPNGPPDLSLTPWEISPLTDLQEKIISLLPIIPGFLSIVGSSIIVYMAVQRGRNTNRNKNKRWTPYTRLLFAMSCFDIISSLALMVTPFLLPRDSSQRVWAFGTDATCTAMGFFQQLQGSALLYNAFLSFYFVLTARFGWKNHELSRIVEPLMHTISIGFPLATATAGAIMGIYHENELGQSCWIANYPEDCDMDGDTSDCKAITLAWIFGGSILLFTTLCIPINNLIIFLFVRRQTIQRSNSKKKNKKRIFATRRAGGGGPSITSTTMSPTSRPNKQVQDDNSSVNSNSVSISRSSKIGGAAVGMQQPAHQLPTTSACFSMTPSMLSSEEASGGVDHDEHQLHHQQRRQQSLDDSSRREDQQLKRLQLVSSQAFLYVGAFVICTTWSFVLKVLEMWYGAEDEGDLYPLLVLQAFFLPLQGFLNVFVYIRPKYLKHRREFPEESRLWAFRRSVHGEDVVLPSASKISRPQVGAAAPGAPGGAQQQQKQQVGSSPPKDKAAMEMGSAGRGVNKALMPRMNISPATLSKNNNKESSIVDLEAPLNDIDGSSSNGGEQIQQGGDGGFEQIASPTAYSRPMPRNNFISSITCEDLDESSSGAEYYEETVAVVEMNKEWRWMSGNNKKPSYTRRNKRGGNTSSAFGVPASSLEAISEISAVSFVDPQEEEETEEYDDTENCDDEEAHHDYESCSSTGSDDSLPDEDLAYLNEDDDDDIADQHSVKSAPTTCSGQHRRVRFLGADAENSKGGENNEESNPATMMKRRWSIGTTKPSTSSSAMDAELQEFQSNHQGLVSFVRYYMFNNNTSNTNTTSNTTATTMTSCGIESNDDGVSVSSDASGSLDPSFDRMESIKTPPANDAPVRRPTRRLSPTDIDVPSSIMASPPTKQRATVAPAAMPPQ